MSGYWDDIKNFNSVKNKRSGGCWQKGYEQRYIMGIDEDISFEHFIERMEKEEGVPREDLGEMFKCGHICLCEECPRRGRTKKEYPMVGCFYSEERRGFFLTSCDDCTIMKSVKKRNSSFLYLIQQDGTDLYKIGMSRDVSKRLEALQTSNPNDLSVLFKVKPDIVYFNRGLKTRDIERFLHKSFKSKRLRGEWFMLDDRDVKTCLYLMMKIDSGELDLY